MFQILLTGRWDFDTQEEYSDYMSTKEALPKAAFQYGVKMQDGRKTRKHKTEKNEKAELDREWQKIQVQYFYMPCAFILKPYKCDVDNNTIFFLLNLEYYSKAEN